MFLALDTGSGRTLLTPAVIRMLGYALPFDGPSERIATVTEVVTRPVMQIQELAALGTRRRDVQVLVSSLPRGVSFHGLLGLDFLRNARLTIDFRRGEIELET
ncbi:MAG: aspartyl protease family protein [Dehalococcoidia bacterium]